MLLNTDIQQSDCLLLMLDYDGTLTPIVPDYNQAQILPEQLEFLRQVAHVPSIQLAIVSGRSVDQLRTFLRDLHGEPLLLVGLHGGQLFDMASSQMIMSPPDKLLEDVQFLKKSLITAGIDQFNGIQLEDKGYSLGVHYRQATSQAAERAIGILKNNMQSLDSDYWTLRPGKQLLEAVPALFNKGSGVNHLIRQVQEQHPHTSLQLLYIGDDITDFDAFRVVNALGGNSIYVGGHLPLDAPAISEQLHDVTEVYGFLEDLVSRATHCPPA